MDGEPSSRTSLTTHRPVAKATFSLGNHGPSFRHVYGGKGEKPRLQREKALRPLVKARGCTARKNKRSGPSVLVVEAEETIRLCLSTFLSTAGYEVTTGGSGEEGLDLLFNRCFDLVLSDLTMAGIDGWTFARHVKDKSPLTKVGLITGWGKEEITTKMKGSAVDFALFKPFGLDELQKAVERVLEETSRENSTYYQRRRNHGIEFQNPCSPEQP